MDMMKSSNALNRVEKNLKQSYRRFFDLDEPLPTMPMRQLRLFAQRAYEQHLTVAIQMRGGHVAVGFVNHRLNDDTFIMRSTNGHVDQIIRLAQCQYIKQCAL